MSSIQLKVKSKHLSAEARIIREEESKQLKYGGHNLKRHRDSGNNDFVDENNHYRNLYSLREHRKGSLRVEARATHIAHALLKGVDYGAIEKPRADNPPAWERVKKMLFRYGGQQGREIIASMPNLQ